MYQLFNKSHNQKNRINLRADMPEPERRLWCVLRGKQLGGFKFRRQHGIGNYIVDFYCREARLIVEIDGDSHYWDNQQQYDNERDVFMTSRGIAVFRCTNDDVMENIEGVCERLLTLLEEHKTPPPPSP